LKTHARQGRNLGAQGAPRALQNPQWPFRVLWNFHFFG
jgi:hypothetical protein